MIHRPCELTLVVVLCILLASTLGGCTSPEDGRPRGGGPGADGGNYRGKPIHAPSKIDGTKQNPDPLQTRETG
jgi:hypothetical protein